MAYEYAEMASMEKHCFMEFPLNVNVGVFPRMILN